MDTLNIQSSGKPWKYSYTINDKNKWTVDGLFPINISNSEVVILKDKVYIIGGYNGSIVISDVYSAKIKDNGTLDSWEYENSLLDPLSSSQAVVFKDYIIMLGGFDGRKWTKNITIAKLTEKGKLGNWLYMHPLPSSIGESQSLLYGNRIYLLGGYDGYNYSTSVYTATIEDNGSISEWENCTNLPIPVRKTSSIILNNNIYIIGGYDGSPVSEIYVSSINSDGSLTEWKEFGKLPEPLFNTKLIEVKNALYLIGGNDSELHSSKVYKANIIQNKYLLGWEEDIPLPNTLSKTNVININDIVYLIGGFVNGKGTVREILKREF